MGCLLTVSLSFKKVSPLFIRQLKYTVYSLQNQPLLSDKEIYVFKVIACFYKHSELFQ